MGFNNLIPKIAIELTSIFCHKTGKAIKQKGKNMFAKIFQPARNVMQSGAGQNKLGHGKSWVLEFAPKDARQKDTLMGWTSSGDMNTQVSIRFATKEQAIRYARDNNIPYQIAPVQNRAPVIRDGGYGENFATNRRSVWTH